MDMRVLVVEDEASLAAALHRGLCAEGFAVDVAADGVEGLYRASEYPYDVIVLDLMLPKLSGYEVCRRLRDAKVWTPILMLTAKDGEYDEADALDLGADDYLTKPFSYLVLVPDPAAHSCRRGEHNIALTAREFAVLEYLVRHSNEVVGKLDIVAHVWDEHFEGDPNIVEVYVGYLRRKIDTPFGRHSIETVRGAGYRLSGAGG